MNLVPTGHITVALKDNYKLIPTGYTKVGGENDRLK